MYKPRPKSSRDGPLEVAGFLWSREGLRWRRLLVRQFARTGEYELCEIAYVDPIAEFCHQCLSQNIRIYEYGAAFWTECWNCNAFYTVDDEQV